MSITKSNKHNKHLLDLNKPDEEGGCTLATPYALMSSLISRSSNLNHLTRFFLSLAQKSVFSAEYKWDYPLEPTLCNHRGVGPIHLSPTKHNFYVRLLLYQKLAVGKPSQALGPTARKPFWGHSISRWTLCPLV